VDRLHDDTGRLGDAGEGGPREAVFDKGGVRGGQDVPPRLGGKGVEHWAVRDDAALMHQLTA
jgi:hypothetical protein